MAEITMNPSRARALSDAIRLAQADQSTFTLLAELWSMAYAAGRESEWGVGSMCYNPFRRSDGAELGEGLDLTPEAASELLYGRYRAPSVRV